LEFVFTRSQAGVAACERGENEKQSHVECSVGEVGN